MTTPAPPPPPTETAEKFRLLVQDKDNPQTGQVVEGVLLDQPAEEDDDAPTKPKRAGRGKKGNAESANGCTDKIKPDPSGPASIYQRIGTGTGRKPYKHVGKVELLAELTEDWWHERFPRGGTFRIDSPLADGGNGGRAYTKVDGVHPSMLRQLAGATAATDSAESPAFAAMAAELAAMKAKIAADASARAAARIDWPALLAAGTPILSALLARQDQSGDKVAAAITAANAPLVAALQGMANQPPPAAPAPVPDMAAQMDSMLGMFGKLQEMQTTIRSSGDDGGDGGAGIVDQIVKTILASPLGMPAPPMPAAVPAPGPPAPAVAAPAAPAPPPWPAPTSELERAAMVELQGIEADAIGGGAPFGPGDLWRYAQKQGATSYAHALEVAGQYGLRKKTP